MPNTAQVKAAIPETLKRQAFSIFAARGLKFTPWVINQLEQFVEREGVPSCWEAPAANVPERVHADA